MKKRNKYVYTLPHYLVKDDEGNDVIFPILSDPEIKEEEENIIPLPEEK